MSKLSRNLTPLETVQAAQAVYQIRLSNDVVKAYEGTIIKDKFALGNDARFKGSSGIFRSKSGFGVIGKGTGDRKGEVIIITRGTKTGADWFSNANIKTTMSASNKSVHKGFNNIFNSFKTELEMQLRAMNPTRVHCIGHSLGGALATLIAEWVEAKSLGSPHIYTFGSPRVGSHGFSENLTFKLGAERINRAYHKTDVVPMIPVWPYMHGPIPGLSCFINSPGDYPGATYHGLEHYNTSVQGHKSWNTLRKRQPKINLEIQVENWLDSDSPLSFTGRTISMINAAIIYVIKKLALAGLQLVIGEVVNVIDVLANFLAKAARHTKETGKLVGNLLRRILKAMGRVVNEVKNVTYTFVKWVLESFAIALHQTSKMAVGFVHRHL